MTPEGKVKNKINLVLDSHGGRVYYHMPVPCGYGRSTLDYIGFAYGRGFAIEAKRRGKLPSERQEGIIEDMEKAGGTVFRVLGDDGLLELTVWLEELAVKEAP